MYSEDDDLLERLGDEYEDWLCERCNCNERGHMECGCPSFNEWFDELRRDAVEGMEQDYQEQYA